MKPPLDLSELKAQLLSDQSSSLDHRVEVNQRHLIDKILARYSSEFTIFREVIQNANDAGAKVVQIAFDVDEAGLVTSLSIQNNGRIFSEEDWSRLKKIAEGNPDESKIGFFGVGFYSLFSICEDPFVASWDKCMTFLWKGDQLYTRTIKVDQPSNLTNLYLTARKPFELPAMDSFAEFVGKTLLFAENLLNITVVVNGTSKFKLSKNLNVSEQHRFPTFQSLQNGKNLFAAKDTFSEAEICLVYEKDFTSVKQAQNLLGRFWKSVSKILDIDSKFAGKGTWEVNYKLVTWSLTSHPTDDFRKSYARVVKKYPPASSSISFIMPSNVRDTAGMHPLFSAIIPAKEQGKLFIGFETHQTSSAKVHVNGPFIPTVERESLDFVDPVLCAWNKDLLVNVGRFERLYYDFIASRNEVDLIHNATAVFGFEISSPSQVPSNIVCDTFFTYTSNDILVPSNVGIVPISQLRYVPQEMRLFLRSVATLKYDDNASTFVENLRHYYSIPDVGAADVISELKQRKIREYHDFEIIFNWLLDNWTNLSAREKETIKNLIHVPISNDGLEWRPLSDIKFITNRTSQRLPFLPSTCIFPTFGQNHIKSELAIYLGLTTLTIATWFDNVANADRIRTDNLFAEEVLLVISENYSGLTSRDRSAIVKKLTTLQIIPTVKGMLLPSMTFFESVDILDNLPIIDFKKRRLISEEMLRDIGVKSHLPLAEIFANLKDWNYQKLADYLTRNRHDLQDNEIQALKNIQIFQSTDGTSHSLSELYLESPASVHLRLPVLKWDFPLEKDKNLLGFLSDLGLNMKIPLACLLQGIVNSNAEGQLLLLNHFQRSYNADYAYEYLPRKIAIKFVPTESGTFEHPTECFQNNEVTLLGFPIIRGNIRSFAVTLQIPQRPHVGQVLDVFMSKKVEVEQAQAVIEFMSSYSKEINGSQWNALRSHKFIPVTRGEEKTDWVSPEMAFFTVDEEFQSYFVLVDFGPGANVFLKAAGVKDKPSVVDLASILVDNADDLIKRLGVLKYMAMLQTIAINKKDIIKADPSIFERMKCARCLLGSRSLTDAENKIYREYRLCTLNEVYLVDDSLSLHLFDLYSVPHDSLLEKFYEDLGCKWVGRVVHQVWIFYGDPINTELSAAEEESIRFRAPILIDNLGKSNVTMKDCMTLLRSVKLQQVSGIELKRTFGEITKISPMTACLKDPETILITEPFDHFDIATSLSKILFEDPKMEDILLLSTLLSMSIESLRAKGFSVERLGMSEAELKLNTDLPPPPPQDEKQPEEKKPQDSTDKLTEPPKEQTYEKKPEPAKDKQENKKSFMDKIRNFLDPDRDKPLKYDDRRMQDMLTKNIQKSKSVKDAHVKLTKQEREVIADTPMIAKICSFPVDANFFLAFEANGLKVFSENDEASARILHDRRDDVAKFSAVLIKVGSIYGLSPKYLNIYLLDSTVVAFNKDNSLFFSLHHFMLQLKEGRPKKFILGSWFVTMAHELAHNAASDHDETHGFIMSSYIEYYLEALWATSV